VFHFEVPSALFALEGRSGFMDSEMRVCLEQSEQYFLQNTRQNPAHLVRLVEPSLHCNCYGWIFSGGRYGMYGWQVPLILRDNGYQPVTTPQESDVAVYVAQGDVVHAGIARIDRLTGSLLIESKWGPFGVFLHAPAAHPFGGVAAYYRSPRGGHANRLQNLPR
jgi:hypothetical protein